MVAHQPSGIAAGSNRDALLAASILTEGSYQQPAPVTLVSASAGDSNDPPLFSEAEGKATQDNTGDSEGDENTFKILIATDTHLGFKGEDPVRGNDSFRTFEEILQIGRREKVDFLLHGGDFFDENKPSRTTLYRAMCLLRKYCFGPGRVLFDVLSGSATPTDSCSATQPSASCNTAADHFSFCKDGGTSGPEASRKITDATAAEFAPSSTQNVAPGAFRFGLNYLNENINICMPVFAMHGNHDDPGDASHLSPLDILEAAHLINYFGRVDNVEDIRVRPILMQKGLSKLAIYGTGWVRDERLHRAYISGKVTYEVPAEGAQNWFNLLVIHQNMYKGGHGGVPAKNCVLDRMLPSFADIAIWGHEHDCHTELRQAQETRCQVLQPGSSIATSLTAGEAQQKHVFILEIREECFRLRALPLQTVRPMIVEDICLADICGSSQRGAHLRASGEAAADREAWEALTGLMEDILRRYGKMVGLDLTANAALPVSQQLLHQQDAKAQAAPRRRQAYQLFCNYRAGATQDLAALANTSSGGPIGEALITRGPAEVLQRLPLVRVRVEHSGFSTISAPRFASQFVGRVANPDSLLCFYKKRSSHQTASADSSALPELELEHAPGAGAAEIHDIIFHYMEDSSGLNVLSEPEFNDAVQDFVIKMDPSAIAAFVANSISAARLHARAELLRRLRTNPEAPQRPEDVRAIIADFTQAARMRRLDAAECDDQTAQAAPSGSSSQSLNLSGMPVASVPAAPAPSSGPLAAEVPQAPSTWNAEKERAPGAPSTRPPSGDEEEDGLDVEFSGASAAAPFQRPSRGAPKKRPVGERGRGRKGAPTRGRKNNAATLITESDSQDEAGETQAAALPDTAAAPPPGRKQQRDIRSLLSQLSGKRGIRSQATSGSARAGLDPPDVPTQEDDDLLLDSVSQMQRSSHEEDLAASVLQARHLTSKKTNSPRPALPLEPLQAREAPKRAGGEATNPSGFLRPSTWTKRARLDEAQNFGLETEECEFAPPQNSLRRGASATNVQNRALSWKRR